MGDRVGLHCWVAICLRIDNVKVCYGLKGHTISLGYVVLLYNLAQKRHIKYKKGKKYGWNAWIRLVRAKKHDH